MDGRVVWLYGSEGLHEMRGLEGLGGGGLSGCMDYMRGGRFIYSIRGCWLVKLYMHYYVFLYAVFTSVVRLFIIF